MADTPEHGIEHDQFRILPARTDHRRRRCGRRCRRARCASADRPPRTRSSAAPMTRRPTCVLFNGKIHTMDDRNSVVSGRAHPRWPVRRGRPGRRPRRRRRRSSTSRPYGHPGDRREPHPLRQPRATGRATTSPNGSWRRTSPGAGVPRRAPPRRARGPVHHRDGRRLAGHKYAENRLPTPGRARRGGARPAGVPLRRAAPGRPSSTASARRSSSRSPTPPSPSSSAPAARHRRRPNTPTARSITCASGRPSRTRSAARSTPRPTRRVSAPTTVLDQALPPPNTVVPPRDVRPGAARPAADPRPVQPQPLPDVRRVAGRPPRRRQLIRLQMNFLHNQGYIPAALEQFENQLPELRERLRNQFPFFGDEWVRTGGIGEWAAPFALQSANPDGYAVWREAQRLVAQARWRNENAQAGSKTNPANIDQVVRGLRGVRRRLRHQGPALGPAARRLRHRGPARPAQGAQRGDLGLRPPLARRHAQHRRPAQRHDVRPDQGQRHPVGPAPGRRAHRHAQPLFALHYAITGLNVAGVDINAGQRLTRQEALYAYTRGPSWYLNRENDLVDRDRQVRRPGRARQGLLQGQRRRGAPIRPILTVVNGEIVHDTGVLRGRH